MNVVSRSEWGLLRLWSRRKCWDGAGVQTDARGSEQSLEVPGTPAATMKARELSAWGWF